MALKGLYVGIDRYAYPEVGWLSCAKRDATAVHTLLEDNLGGSSVLLTDEGATLAAIRSELSKLTSCAPEDTVVIYFSGHGTNTHELVTHDTSIFDIENTALPLEELRSWFEHIPARRLLLVLDCCFSGGMGAKVLKIETVPRSPTSVGAKLDLLGGDGRIILTASSATQEAYENPRLGHGFLTDQLLQGLQGPEELRDGDTIGIFRLLEWVSRRVTDAARGAGREQEPSVRGTFDGELIWPICVPGPQFLAAFPERVRANATSEISTLAAFGFPQALLDAWAGEIPQLNDLQVCAINDYGVLDDQHLLVSAPTSSGKTMLGELAALKGAGQRRRSLFLFPLKALVADKLRYFDRLYGPLGLTTIEATGETDDLRPLLRGQYDIALLTYEKFANIALTHPHVLNQVGTIVVDEVQMVADLSRGANLEFLFTLLQMHRRRGVEPQMIALSAVIGDTQGFERWLGGRLLRRTERPVPLDEGLLLRDGRFRFIDGDGGGERSESHIRPDYAEGKSRDWVVPLVRKLVDEGKQVIVFRETTGETRHCARYLADALNLSPATAALDSLPTGDETRASRELRDVLGRGVAFHNSHLHRDERSVVEEQFRAKDTTLRVIAATTTLAMGVNTPASAVVIVGLEHPGDQPYSVAEYKNLVGRAGRLGFAERGTSYLLATDTIAEHSLWSDYLLATPEDLTSRFLDADPRTLIMRILVAARSAGGLTAEEIIEFLESSFAAHLQRRQRDNWAWDRFEFERHVAELAELDFIRADVDGRYTTTAIGRLAGESALEIESIFRVVRGLRNATPAQLTDPSLVALSQVTCELDQVYFPMNKRAIHKEPAQWFADLTRQGVSHAIQSAVRAGAVDQMHGALRAKKAVSCLYYVSDTDIGDIENAMTQFGGSFDGAAGPIRGAATRTCDVLPTVGRLAELLHPDLLVGERIERLVLRLEHGLPADMVDLARHTGRHLNRSDYRRLKQAGMNNPEAIEEASEEALLRYLDGDAAKLRRVRAASAALLQARAAGSPIPALAPYEA